MWNSGRLENISATVSPFLTPRPASPPARASTRSRSSAKVRRIESSLVRTATRSGVSSTVMRKASAIVAAFTARRPVATVLLSMFLNLSSSWDDASGPY